MGPDVKVMQCKVKQKHNGGWRRERRRKDGNRKKAGRGA
jgi:hypothetical protein